MKPWSYSMKLPSVWYMPMERACSTAILNRRISCWIRTTNPGWPISANRVFHTNKCRPWAPCSTWRPEQADLEAMPDARWDVYALGALLYCMLTGHPPHRSGPTVDQFERTPDLKQRLSQYRQMIEQSLPPAEHCEVPGVDSLLADIVDRCLAADPERRFPNVQSVIDALKNRETRRARRPIMVLGAIGPALLLAVVAWFSWQGFNTALRESNAALTDRALNSATICRSTSAPAQRPRNWNAVTNSSNKWPNPIGFARHSGSHGQARV